MRAYFSCDEVFDSEKLMDILCIGGATIDRKLKSLAQLEVATSNQVNTTVSFGGVARNIAENLGRWTTGVHLQTIVGDDADGHQLLRYMKLLNVNIDACQYLSAFKTAHYYAVLNADGELFVALADMDIFNQVTSESIIKRLSICQTSDLVVLDTNLPAFVLAEVISYAISHQLRLCIDPVSTSKAKKLPLQLDGLYLIKPDRAEASALTGLPITTVSEALAAGTFLYNRGVQQVVITLGSVGYVIVNDDGAQYIQCRSAQIVNDVSGAGDAFVAGVLYGLQQQLGLYQACQYGSAAAYYTIQASDTVNTRITAQQLRDN